MGRHAWNKDEPRPGWSTCQQCDLEVKTYRIKKGNLPKCDEYRGSKRQIKLDCKPPCLDPQINLNPVISCFHCPGNIVAAKCDELRRMGGYHQRIQTQREAQIAALIAKQTQPEPHPEPTQS